MPTSPDARCVTTQPQTNTKANQAWCELRNDASRKQKQVPVTPCDAVMRGCVMKPAAVKYKCQPELMLAAQVRQAQTEGNHAWCELRKYEICDDWNIPNCISGGNRGSPRCGGSDISDRNPKKHCRKTTTTPPTPCKTLCFWALYGKCRFIWLFMKTQWFVIKI